MTNRDIRSMRCDHGMLMTDSCPHCPARVATTNVIEAGIARAIETGEPTEILPGITSHFPSEEKDEQREREKAEARREVKAAIKHSLKTGESVTLKSGSVISHPSGDRAVEHPRHYLGDGGRYEVWDFVRAHDLGFLEGNVVKYVTRWRRKGGLQDLKKAQEYLTKLIETAEVIEFKAKQDEEKVEWVPL